MKQASKYMLSFAIFLILLQSGSAQPNKASETKSKEVIKKSDLQQPNKFFSKKTISKGLDSPNGKEISVEGDGNNLTLLENGNRMITIVVLPPLPNPPKPCDPGSTCTFDISRISQQDFVIKYPNGDTFKAKLVQEKIGSSFPIRTAKSFTN